MQFGSLRLTFEGPLAFLDVAPAASAATLFEDCDAAAAAIQEETNLRCVVVHLAANVGHDAGQPAGRQPARLPFRSLETVRPPLIAAIEGDCAGPLIELALACDIRVADERTIFSMPEAAEGRLQVAGGIQRLSRTVGRARAAWMLLVGSSLDAQAALDWGLINSIARQGEVMVEASRLAGAICERGPTAVGYAREVIGRGQDMTLDQALRYETDVTVILQTTADRVEGVRAFLEKRHPDFTGS